MKSSTTCAEKPAGLPSLKIAWESDSEWSPLISWDQIQVLENCGDSDFGAIHRGKLGGLVQVRISFIEAKYVNEKLIADLKQSITRLRQYRHPNILQLIGISIQPEFVCVLSEWCAQGSLHNLLLDSDTPLSSALCIKLIMGCNRALSFLYYEKQLSHGELCPYNIYIDSNFVPKLVLRNGFEAMHILYPPALNVPSRFLPLYQTLNGLDGPSDVYALGMIALECFAREPAEMRHISLVLREPFRSLVVWCIQRHPSKRPSFHLIDAALDESLLSDELSFKTYDVPRICSYLDSDVQLLHKLASREILENTPSTDVLWPCPKCRHSHQPRHRSRLLWKSGVAESLGRLLCSTNESAGVLVVQAFASIMQWQNVDVELSPAVVRSLIEWVGSMDRQVSRAARRVLMQVSEDSGQCVKVLQSLDEKYARRFLEELRGDLSQALAKVKDTQGSSVGKEQRLLEYEKCLEQLLELDSPMKKYEFRVQIGTGQFSTVHYVKHNLSGKRYALKSVKLDPQVLKSTPFEQLEQEFHILSRINHPNIISVEDFFVDKTSLYIVMELADSGDLFDLLMKSPNYRVVEEEAKSLSKKILRAIVHLHSLGIVHRDIKPENVLLQSSPNPKDPSKEIVIPKLADFGFATFQRPQATYRPIRMKKKTQISLNPLAKIKNSLDPPKGLRRTYSRVGTEGYCAPEVVQGEGYDEKVDVWSFGIILHILLCGQPPYVVTNKEDGHPFWSYFSEMQVPHNGVLEFPGEVWNRLFISDEAKDLLGMLLEVDPQKRISSREALRHEWFQTRTNLKRGSIQKYEKKESRTHSM